MILLWILIPCLACGALFAYLAVWLTTRKGNTISDILNSMKSKDLNSIKIDILDKVKISSNLPIVALYIVAFCVAILLPAFISWQMLKDVTTITLSGEVKLEPNTKLYVMPEAMQVAGSGSLSIPILYADGSQKFNIEGDYYPVTVQVCLNKLKNSLSINFSSSPDSVEIPLDLVNKMARLKKPIALTRSPSSQQPGVLNKPSEERPVSPDFKNAGSPLEVGK
jgi:hypothetical protein